MLVLTRLGNSSPYLVLRNGSWCLYNAPVYVTHVFFSFDFSSLPPLFFSLSLSLLFSLFFSLLFLHLFHYIHLLFTTSLRLTFNPLSLSLLQIGSCSPRDAIIVIMSIVSSNLSMRRLNQRVARRNRALSWIVRKTCYWHTW